MNGAEIFAGYMKVHFDLDPVIGEFISENEDVLYKISNYDKLNPFLISIVSATDHWFYISSKGGLTCGRKNPDNALFPYITDNLLHDCSETTGSKTIIKVIKNGKLLIWEPFSENYKGIYNIKRNLYKNIYSTKIIFEEVNDDLGISFSYSWVISEKFGFVKSSRLMNFTNQKISFEILDGIQNILPSGLNQQIVTEYSTLVDGYKKNELLEETGLGIFTLSSIPSDIAQPSESLLATTVFCKGIEVDNYLLSNIQLDNFKKNLELKQETDIKGIKGAYFINAKFELQPNSSKDWYFVAEVNQNSGGVIDLNNQLKSGNFLELLLEDIRLSMNAIKRIVFKADGIQLTNDKLASYRHFSNVLFNIMRGGIFDDFYYVTKEDFISFIEKANPYVLSVHSTFLNNLPRKIKHFDLCDLVEKQNDPHFTRLALEYLPLTFSRRHGDPSRPWNKFSIEIKNEKNQRVLNYQGNWRDIFQNWEALALSYPKFLIAMISKFLNTSTVDGYNPYRIFREGFDWEVLEPHNPWSNIGYWGDHQIIYLLKLLELSENYNPGFLQKYFNKDVFSFANVPYRIKSYKEILKDPRSTIIFDEELDRRLKSDENIYGTDSKYLKKPDHTLIQVNLIDKLLLTLLVKISNFIPGGGIWLNTQRPEWNDAQNALVGYGVSMVTLFYMRRYIKFLIELLNKADLKELKISEDINLFFEKVFVAIQKLSEIYDKTISDGERKYIVDLLGEAGSEYRSKVYNSGFNYSKATVSVKKITDFLNVLLLVVDKTIADNRREDGLYHTYNIIHISDNEIKITHLYEMLEGQVAALSSGYLSIEEAIELLTSLKKSKLYREDQNSYLLYPYKELARFIEKNIIPRNLIAKSKLLQRMLELHNYDIVYKDSVGNYHFQSDIINSNVLSKKLKLLENDELKKLAEVEFFNILDIYEKVFKHSEFTGRATTFYKYEGLGCIYWHMVSKLLLAVQDYYFDAERKTSDKQLLKKIKDFYYDIRSGLGTYKTPSEFGAFPLEPYSHTPSFTGAQQPGMTGQVKEDIITRFREIGITIKNGMIKINPTLLSKREFLQKEEIFSYFDKNDVEQKISLKKGSFAVTYCQVPFIFHLSDKNNIILYKSNDKKFIYESLELDWENSQAIFNYDSDITKVEIFLDENSID